MSSKKKKRPLTQEETDEIITVILPTINNGG